MIQQRINLIGNAFLPGTNPAFQVRLRFLSKPIFETLLINLRAFSPFSGNWLASPGPSKTPRVNPIANCDWDRQSSYPSAEFGWRTLCNQFTEFLFRFLPTTSNRSPVQPSAREQFSPTVGLPQQIPTNPDANVCYRGEALNHTSRRSAETQLRVMRAQQFPVSGKQPALGNTGSFCRRERTNQYEKNNVSQCIADRGMSDRDHRRRAA